MKNSEYVAFIEKAMADGKTLNEIRGELDAAVSAIKGKQEAANRYSAYKEPLDFRGSVFTSNVCKRAINSDEMAVIFAHFLCQNVPGYAAYCGERGNDPINSTKLLVDSQLEMTKAQVASKDRPAKDQIDALLSAVLGTLEEEISRFDSTGTSNTDPLIEFLRKNGL